MFFSDWSVCVYIRMCVCVCLYMCANTQVQYTRAGAAVKRVAKDEQRGEETLPFSFLSLSLSPFGFTFNAVPSMYSVGSSKPLDCAGLCFGSLYLPLSSSLSSVCSHTNEPANEATAGCFFSASDHEETCTSLASSKSGCTAIGMHALLPGSSVEAQGYASSPASSSSSSASSSSSSSSSSLSLSSSRAARSKRKTLVLFGGKQVSGTIKIRLPAHMTII